MILQTSSSYTSTDEYDSFWYYNLQTEKQCKSHCILIIIFLFGVLLFTLLCVYSIYNENSVAFNEGIFYCCEFCGFFCRFRWVKKVFNKKDENQFSYHNLENPELN